MTLKSVILPKSRDLSVTYIIFTGVSYLKLQLSTVLVTENADTVVLYIFTTSQHSDFHLNFPHLAVEQSFLSICSKPSCKSLQKFFQTKQIPTLAQLSSSVMILSRLVGEDYSHRLWRPAMNLAAFADSEEDISIQLPLARLQLLRMPF